MKTKSEAATEYMHATIKGMMIDEDLTPSHIDFAFEAGFEAAQEWIGFEKQLPPVMLEIIVKDASERKRKRVFKPLDNTDIIWCAETFTHWRPVERV